MERTVLAGLFYRYPTHRLKLIVLQMYMTELAQSVDFDGGASNHIKQV